MPAEIVSDLKGHGAQVVETEDLYGSMEGADVVYMTRIQKERFADEDEYARCAEHTNFMLVTLQMLNKR